MKSMIHPRISSVLVLAWFVLMGNSAVAERSVVQMSAAPVAKLGSISIAGAEVQRLLQSMPESEQARIQGDRAILESWLRQRLSSEAVLREAQQQRWSERPEVKASIDAATRELTARIVGSSYLESVAQLPAGFPFEEEVKALYEHSKPQLRLAASYRIAQIYLPVAAAAKPETVDAVRAEANRLASQARQGDFSALAKAYSKDTRSAAQGGDVGSLLLAQMLPEFRGIVANLKPQQVSDPVLAGGGFHVLKLLESQPERTATLEEAKLQLVPVLRERRRQELVREHLQKIAPAADVRIDDAALDALLRR